MENQSFQLLSTDFAEVSVVVNMTTGSVYIKVISKGYGEVNGTNLKHVIDSNIFTVDQRDWLYDYFFGDKTSPQRDDFSKY